MSGDGQHPEQRRQQNVAVRQPTGGEAVRVVQREEQPGQAGDQRPVVRANLAIQPGRRRHQQAQPQQAVQVHHGRLARPHSKINPVAQRRQRSPKRHLALRQCPPRIGPAHHLGQAVRRVAIHKDKRLVQRRRQRCRTSWPAQGRAHQVVVELKARRQRRQGEQNRQQAQAPGQARVAGAAGQPIARRLHARMGHGRRAPTRRTR